jgi:phage/plasmid-like protein (TIGR03299 family)
MAHQIYNSEIAYAGETPWHGLGQQIDANAPSAEWLKAAKLNWTLNRCDLVARTEDGTEVDIDDQIAWVRSDNHKPMVISSPNWRPFQNHEALDFMDRYVKAGGATLETVGALKGGKIVWALASINHSFETRPGDTTRGYLLLTTPHIVGMAMSIRTTTVRVVCRNTLTMAEREGTEHFRQNHLSDFNTDRAQEAVANAHENLARAEQRAKTLDGIKIGVEDALRKVILPVFDPEFEIDAKKDLKDQLPRRAAQILASIDHAPGAIEGTAWGILNGITHWADHVAGRGNDARLQKAWLGKNARLKLKAEAKLLDLAD